MQFEKTLNKFTDYYELPYYGAIDYDIPPLRVFTYVFKWDGKFFSFSSEEFTAPEYRFQAIEDADKLVLDGKFSEANSLYQDAIFNNKLDWWSSERKLYLINAALKNKDSQTTSVSPPQQDISEYPRLAAYAYYRMIALHIHLGQMEAAQLKYATLQKKFPAGSPGHPYAEMATAFWDAYQSTGKMYDACGAAITYADAHPEILIPLGSDYHGAQSHTYVPADVCPFR
jgi:hypothetical protein